MPRKKRAHPKEIREQIIELSRRGRSPSDLSRSFGICRTTIYRWREQADFDDGLRTDGLMTSEREEVAELKREVIRLKLERDILAKAAAWFAREADSIPERSSNS